VRLRCACVALRGLVKDRTRVNGCLPAYSKSICRGFTMRLK
jgi:hypothetical protein